MRFPIGKTLPLAVLISFSLAICTAQTAADKPAEPESIAVFYYLDSAGPTLKRLPQEEFKKHTGGFGKIVTSVKVAGEASAFHIGPSDKATFVFKVFKDEQAAGAKLYQFEIKGSERSYDLGKWTHRDYTPNTGLPVDVAKFGESSYKVTPSTPLSPGEYALTLGATLYTFGVK